MIFFSPEFRLIQRFIQRLEGLICPFSIKPIQMSPCLSTCKQVEDGDDDEVSQANISEMAVKATRCDPFTGQELGAISIMELHHT